MAFQRKQPFFSFLQSVAAPGRLDEFAPAQNYILDERVPDAREEDYLAHNAFATIPSIAYDDWLQHSQIYAFQKVAKAPASATFQDINRDNWLGIGPESDVVRIETLSSLISRGGSAGVPDTEIQTLLQSLLSSRKAGKPMSALGRSQLDKWLDAVNAASDRRPAFVAPYANVEPLLKQSDWANRLRDALGLGHIQPDISGRPKTVVLMQYSLERVYQAHLGNPAWAATPTVLDDVPQMGLNPYFFPGPKAATGDGFGYTVHLGAGTTASYREFLHAHVPYTLDDIRDLGEVTTVVSDADSAAARLRHRNTLGSSLLHKGDLP